MDIKSKKSNKRLIAIVVAFLLCVSAFSVAVTIGMEELLRASQVSDPFQIMTSKTYGDSGSLQDEFSSNFRALYWGRVDEEKQNFDDMIENMTQKGFTFYMTDGKSVFTNIAGGNEGLPLSEEELSVLGQSAGAYRIYDDGKLLGEPTVSKGMVYGDRRLADLIEESMNNQFMGESESGSGSGVKTIYMAFSESYISAANAQFDSVKDHFATGMIIALLSALVSLISFIVLCIFCGKQDELGRPVLTGIDRWFTELVIAALIGCVTLGCFTSVASVQSYHNDFYYNYYGYDYGYYTDGAMNGFELALLAVGLWFAAAASLLFLMALVKKAKAGRFLRDFFVIKIILWIWIGLKDIYYGSNVMKKVIIVVALICLCSATIVFFPVVLVVSLVFASKWVKQYELIKAGVQEVKNGNPSYKILINGEPQGELQQLAADINAISEGFDVAVKQELKNQRMKTELISNVSHDIKTPLTSIITYVDLLKKEGLDCEDASKYLDILDQKSVRLKKLTEDLFEAAKASSGDIPVQMEKVELMSLLNQTLGELDDRLAARGLDVIVKADQDKYYVAADGQLMWRVLENLFGNAIKYALENSRVYVDIREEQIHADGRRGAILEMKNVSQNALNIPADELMERFKRGDEARSTEGSGLGLSIAKDLVSMQHGKFSIVIDGDLFKAIIALEVCQ